jgi:hypothetical protein
MNSITNEEIIVRIEKQLLIQRFIWRVVLISVVVFTLTLLYWTFEPDPLSVTRIDNDCTWSECSNRRYQFTRLVHSSKDIDIYVQERWHNLDGMMDEVIPTANGLTTIEGELVISKPVHYPLGKDFNKIMTFNKTVPSNITLGRYEYRPWATYRVNPIKTITRMLPNQMVNVVCDYDREKHGQID